MNPTRVVTLAGLPAAEAEVAPRLAGDPRVDLLLRCVDRVELLGALRGGGLDAVITVGVPVWLDRDALEEISARGCALVGLSDLPDEREMLASWGAAVLEVDADVSVVLARCSNGSAPVPVRPSSQPETARGRLVSVWGPKGAPGTTTIAIELAFEMAAAEDVLLLDGDPYGGDVVQHLGVLEEVPTVVWGAATAARDEMDAARLQLDLRASSKSGPALLAGLPRGELWQDVPATGWPKLITTLRASFGVTVCDTGFCLESDTHGALLGGPGRNRMTLAAIEASDQVVAVCRADPVGVKTFLWAFEDLTRSVDPDRIRLVANRVRKGDERELALLLKKHTGKRPVAYVGDVSSLAHRAMTEGRAMKEVEPGSDVASAMRTLAASLGSKVQPRGFLTRLGGTKTGPRRMADAG